MIRRLALLTLVMSTLLAVAGNPASAAKPVPTASITWVWTNCTVKVTYTWSGFTGRVLPVVTVSKNDDPMAWLGDAGVASTGRAGTSSGSFTWFISSATPANWSAAGHLVDISPATNPATLVPGSERSTSTSTKYCTTPGAPN